MVGFIFGGNTGLSYDELQEKRRRAELLQAQILGKKPQTALEGWGTLLGSIGGSIARGQADKGLQEGRNKEQSRYDSILSKITGQDVQPSGLQAASLPSPGAVGEMAANNPTPDVSKNGSTFSPFIDTVKAGGLTNPYGLAAVAATGKAESGWSPENAARSWSDPSERGQAGTAGGVMSWRAERLANLQRYASEKGEQGNGSPQTQAEFFMREDPTLVAKLNAARSTEEAQSLMNGAWKFAGYNRPGGEAGRRMSLANAYAPQFQSQGGTQVASLDPSAGMPAMSAIERQAPGSGYVDPQVAAPNAMPPQQQGPAFDAGRFGDPIKLAEMPAAMNDAGQRLSQQASAYAGNASAPAGGLQPLPSRDVGPAPQVAGMPQQNTGQQPAPPQAGQQVAQARQPMPQMPQIQPFKMDPEVMRFLSSPFADEAQKETVRAAVAQQQQQHAQRQEQAVWQYRQDYEQYQQSNDPVRALQIQKMQQDLSAPRKKDTSVVNGRLVDNQTGQVIAEYPDAQKPTADRQNYDFYRQFEQQNGRTPLGPLEWEQAQRKAGASNTTNVVGGEGDKFYQKLDEKNAEMFATLSDGGTQARGKLGQIDRLEGLFQNVPQGIEGGFKKIASDFGVPIGEGVSDIQAASALLERMVPEQRAPGTGPMSDADIKMFRSSLPRVINQPGGNQLIFQTMRGITQYEMQMGEIADSVADRSITPAEGRKRIRELKNPLDNFKIPEGSTPNEGWKDVSPGIRFKRIGN